MNESDKILYYTTSAFKCNSFHEWITGLSDKDLEDVTTILNKFFEHGGKPQSLPTQIGLILATLCNGEKGVVENLGIDELLELMQDFIPVSGLEYARREGYIKLKSKWTLPIRNSDAKISTTKKGEKWAKEYANNLAKENKEN